MRSDEDIVGRSKVNAVIVDGNDTCLLSEESTSDIYLALSGGSSYSNEIFVAVYIFFLSLGDGDVTLLGNCRGIT